MLKPFPYVLRRQPERIADRQEGEEPARVITEKPILSLPSALNKPLLRLKLLMKAEKSIFEHSIHQRRLRADGSEFDPRVEELFRKHAVVGWPLICGGSAGGDRLASLPLASGDIRGGHSVLLITNRSLARRASSCAMAEFTCK
jgi:hypothetical protein